MSDDIVAVNLEGPIAREVQSWGDWAGIPLPELVNRICRQWIAARWRATGNDETADEWLDEEAGGRGDGDCD